MQILRGRTTGIESLAVSPDSRYVAAGGLRELHVWDLHDPDSEPTCVYEPTRRGNPSYSLQFLGDGRLFNVGAAGWRRYNLADGETARWRRPTTSATCGAASPCGRFVLERSYVGGFCCYRLAEGGSELRGQLAWSLPAVRLLSAPVFAPDSERFAAFSVGGDPRAVHSWTIHRTADGQPLLDLGVERAECYSPGQFTPDSRKFLAGVRSHVYEWDVRAGGEGRLAARHPSGRHFRGLAVHPGGATLAATTNDTDLSLYDLAGGGVLRTYDWRVGRLNQVAFTPDGTRCAVAGASGKVLLFDAE